jgi:hypothetical protein
MKNREDYEQMVLDTRPDLELAIEAVAGDAITTALALLERHYEIAAERGGSYTGPVRNRHEAYGIAAEQMGKINGAVKSIADDTKKLLGILSDPNRTAVEAVSDIHNSTLEAAVTLVTAAAIMKRTMQDLYHAETFDPAPTPLDELAESGGFQEAEPISGTEEDEDAGTGNDETEE